MERICVAVRVRPPTKEEPVKGNYWRVEDNQISLHNALGTPISGYSYAFDHVFGYDSKNRSIYGVHTKDLIEAAVNGFNGTVFAYGQTSSGKTYTMQGSPEDPGIIRLAVYNVFKNIELITDREFLIRVSYMEIYNEEINDLLAHENQKLQVHENLERGIFVAGLREEIVNSPDQVFELVELGEVHRHVGETNMNARSSRSHSIFRMVIESRVKDAERNGSSYDKDAVRVSVLNLVDLAGSERVAKTGAGGVRLKEGTHINKSLMSLGTVINKLSEGGGKQRGHIPYRDSKLTRILQPALGGNAKTAIICTIAPEEIHTDETRGTLQFASRAKRVTNCAKVNEIMTDAALLKRQKKEIEELRKKLQGSHSGVLEQEILKLRNDMLKFELEREKLAMELEEERKAQLERDRRIMEQQQKIENLSTLVINSDQDRNSYKLNSCDHSFPPRRSLESLNQEGRSTKNGCREGSLGRRVTLRKEKFQTPTFESVLDGSSEKPHSFSRLPDGSPLPSDFGNVADEDMWMNMNKGHVTAELDFFQSTPNRNHSSVPSYMSSVHGIVEEYQGEIESLKEQLEKALQDKQEVEKCLESQLMLNDELKMVVSDLEEISRKLGEVTPNCKEDQKGSSSFFQAPFPQEKSVIGACVSATEAEDNDFSSLKAKFTKFVNLFDWYKKENSELHQQCQMLNKQLNHAVASLVLTTDSCTEKEIRSVQNKEHVYGTDFTGLKVSKECHTATSFLQSADSSSRILPVPLSGRLRQISSKVCKMENDLGGIPFINVDALCSHIENTFCHLPADDLSDSKSAINFIMQIQCKESDKLEDGNLFVDVEGENNKRNQCDENVQNKECLEYDSKIICDEVYDRKSTNMYSGIANVILLAKWLVEEFKSLAPDHNCFVSNCMQMNPATGKLFKGLQICLKEIAKVASEIHLAAVEKEHCNSNSNLDVDLTTHGDVVDIEGNIFQSEESMNLWERLKMSAEHVSSLDNKLALLNIEKDAISKALENELSRQEKKQLDKRFSELLVHELSQLSAAMAGRDAVFASICSGIREFEDNLENRRSFSLLS
ncbi:kinesin-like protein KIN-7L isoform X2 [Cryptomeria japonica]|uniref:kinesin-like protein KIN-7L isoform X2 n=1 Tax=Cryptomeria japonica TaxID=3369 RepID=UPI0027DA9192|nr:kinesin-like protein KIN-7L isoform X2 [Cryptomeria japonica]